MARTIKRYENRKLYDTEASAYVSLAELGALIRSGETVEVVDNVTGVDLTAQTLTQVILEEGRSGRSALPADLLHALIRRSSDALDARFEQLRHGVDDMVQSSVGRLSQLVQRPRAGELQQLRAQLAHLERLLTRVIEESERRNADGAEEAPR